MGAVCGLRAGGTEVKLRLQEDSAVSQGGPAGHGLSLAVIAVIAVTSCHYLSLAVVAVTSCSQRDQTSQTMSGVAVSALER